MGGTTTGAVIAKRSSSLSVVFITEREVDRAVPCSMLKNGSEAANQLKSPDGAADPPFQQHAPALNCKVFLSYLECTSCGLRNEWPRLQNLCTACQKPLFAIIDLAAVGHVLTRDALAVREKSLWRYRALLPLPERVD